jgi:galactose mutarotase-like enzyme
MWSGGTFEKTTLNLRQSLLLARKKKRHGVIQLETCAARLSVSPHGAEIREWSIGDRPLIWRPDPATWAETAPILFPVVGWTKNSQIRVGDATYPLGLHGFARHRTFEIIENTADVVRLRLQSDTATRRLYPFDFHLTVAHRLTAERFETQLTVENTGAGAMPYACGVHPGFRWPFAGGAASDYVIRFDAPEDPEVPVIAPGGLIGNKTRHLPLDQNVLPLSGALFENDALCFLNPKSRGLRFEAPGGATIRLETEDFPHLALWRRPGAAFLCLEAWTGYSDPADFSGAIFAKPSMRLLEPGSTARHGATYAYLPPPARR